MNGLAGQIFLFYCLSWIPGVCLLGILAVCAYVLVWRLRARGDDFMLWELELQTVKTRATKKVKRQ